MLQLDLQGPEGPGVRSAERQLHPALPEATAGAVGPEVDVRVCRRVAEVRGWGRHPGTPLLRCGRQPRRSEAGQRQGGGRPPPARNIGGGGVQGEAQEGGAGHEGRALLEARRGPQVQEHRADAEGEASSLPGHRRTLAGEGRRSQGGQAVLLGDGEEVARAAVYHLGLCRNELRQPPTPRFHPSLSHSQGEAPV